MNNRRIISIFGVMLILMVLLTMLPVSPAYATITYTFTLSPTTGKIGSTVNFTVVRSTASSSGLSANIFFTPTGGIDTTGSGNLTTSAASYMRVQSGIGIPSTTDMNPGTVTSYFIVPSTIAADLDNPLDGGTTDYPVTSGTYYVYLTIGDTLAPSCVVPYAVATFVVTAPTVDPLSPASGPPGQSVVISGSNFPVSSTLTFKFDTSTLTPSSGLSTTSGGMFLSTIAIPSTAAAGAHTITVSAGTGSTAASVTATFTVVIATVTPASVDSILPTSGAAGSQVTLSGSNFAASAALSITFDDTALSITGGSTATGSTGGFMSQVRIPTTATAGSHTITVVAGAKSGTVNFTVTGTQTTSPTTTSPTTTTPTSTTPLTLNYNAGAIGTAVAIAGNSFTPSHAFMVSYNKNDGTSVNMTGTVQSNGSFILTFQIPPSRHGVHTITATDGTHIATADFTVESVAPATPQPQRPYMDETVNSPVSFEWSAVTDDSAPVTYNLQIATDSGFSTDSTVINKTGITTAGYKLTDADSLKLSVGVTYYWREKAVDAALNESAWTGANQFILSQPFQFTGWPLYATIGIAAFLLFLLGIWIGRRSAYNY